MKDLPSMRLKMIGKQEMLRGQFPESNKLCNSRFYKLSDGVEQIGVLINKIDTHTMIAG